MSSYKHEFIKFALSQDVLKFGEFTLKSGRISPYFFNAGLFNTGASMARLGDYYSQAIQEANFDTDLIYGPAYKGIPLAAVTAAVLYQKYNKDIAYAYNRKEVKDHGEGGTIVGHPLAGKNILVIDDVISAGTSVRESFDIIEQQKATLSGVIVALDRQEKGTGETSAIQEVEKDYNIRVASIINLHDLIQFLQEVPEYHEHLEKIEVYKNDYGVVN